MIVFMKLDIDGYTDISLPKAKLLTRLITHILRHSETNQSRKETATRPFQVKSSDPANQNYYFRSCTAFACSQMKNKTSKIKLGAKYG